MASTNRVLGAEYIAVVAITSYGAIRAGFVPWPAAIVKTGIGFTLLGLLGTGAPELAVLLGAGFLLADILKLADPTQGGGWAKNFGALPPKPAAGGDYYSLTFPGKKAP